MTIGVVSVIAAIGLAIVGPLAIEVLLGGGAFDAEDVRLTATVLTAFAISVPFDAIGHLLARGLYATHNTLLPLVASLAGFAVTIVTTLALVGPRRHRRDPARVRGRPRRAHRRCRPPRSPTGCGPRRRDAARRLADPPPPDGRPGRRQSAASGATFVGTTAMNRPSRSG